MTHDSMDSCGCLPCRGTCDYASRWRLWKPGILPFQGPGDPKGQGGCGIHGVLGVLGDGEEAMNGIIRSSELEEAVATARKQVAKGPLIAWVRDYALVLLYEEVQRLNGDTTIQPLSERLKR